jgi:hypothetical protein
MLARTTLAFTCTPGSLLQAGLLRSPSPPPPGSFLLLVGEDAGKVFVVGEGREAARKVQAFREQMGDAVMDAAAYQLMRQRQVTLLTALLVWGDSYRMDVLGREGERAHRASACLGRQHRPPQLPCCRRRQRRCLANAPLLCTSALSSGASCNCR